jgi:hypothetical protein
MHPPASTRHYDEIPAGYPWLTFVDDLGSQGHVDGPDDQVKGPALAPCRHRTWQPAVVIDRRGVASHFLEGGQFRQVLLFRNARAAQRAVNAVRIAYLHCPVQHFSHGWAEKFVVTTPASQGALAVSKQAEQQGNPALGLEELRWVRISNAVIYTWDTYDAAGNDPLPGRAADRRLDEMATAWCNLAGGC